MSIDVMEQMRGAFRAEALDLLIELDSALLALEEETGSSTLVHRVFRAIHTIKGSGATAGFTRLARFAHGMEEAFDLAREGRLTVTPELIDCGLKACDVIRLIIEEKSEGAAIPGERDAMAAFAKLLPASSNCNATQGEDQTPETIARAAFEITFKPKREMFYSGADPVTLLDDLRELGQAHITAHSDQVPLLPSLEPEHCYLWWEILLVTDRDQAAIRDVFVFAEDDCEVRIRLLDDQESAVSLLGSVPAEAFELFVLECEDHLEAMESDALALEADPAARDELDSLFRGIHSIKGNAGLLLGDVKGEALSAVHPLQLLLRVAHGLESHLDPFRGATAGPLTEQTIQTVLETCDAVRNLLGRLKHTGAGGPVSLELLARLGVQVADRPVVQPVDAREAAFVNTTSQCVEMIASCFQRIDSGGEATRPVLEAYLRGLKTLSAAAQYRQCAELEEPLAQQLRILDAAMSAGSTLGGEDRSALESAFRVTRSALDHISAGGGVSDTSQPAAAAPVPRETTEDRKAASASPSTIRIDQIKLDGLMRIVGELLVARGAFPPLVQKLTDGKAGAGLVKDLKDAGSSISRIADELQSSVMSIRMLPVKSVFQRFPRLVRDLARSLGKEVQLVIEGEGIELDKTILEQIGDPLVHVIRNAVDHGLETPEERRSSGKGLSGQLTLRARHEAGGVVIEIADDGRGLDAEALKRKAVDKGLLAPEAAAGMSDEAAFQLVFLPGLTTAAKVTDVSGRGVGMDVVRSNVRALHGAIEIHSQPGRGTTFLIKLPTSLMVSKGILLEAAGEQYILPLSSIHDMVKLPLEAAHQYRGLTLAPVRGRIYSIFNLAEMLGQAAAQQPELSIAIVEAGTVRYGLVVDKFMTEVEVLVKPLTGALEQCKEFQGAAIMGDGRVVLVLNPLECHSLDVTACI
ncbi:Hpt domain-containing protein [Paludibaculum fermentans]|uniref:chemotaxis protein CheA n=1 Tax=Paludibaculum fermentans TaxID=1473598 RepID=UPI003EBA3655